MALGIRFWRRNALPPCTLCCPVISCCPVTPVSIRPQAHGTGPMAPIANLSRGVIWLSPGVTATRQQGFPGAYRARAVAGPVYRPSQSCWIDSCSTALVPRCRGELVLRVTHGRPRACVQDLCGADEGAAPGDEEPEGDDAGSQHGPRPQAAGGGRRQGRARAPRAAALLRQARGRAPGAPGHPPNLCCLPPGALSM